MGRFVVRRRIKFEKALHEPGAEVEMPDHVAAAAGDAVEPKEVADLRAKADKIEQEIQAKLEAARKKFEAEAAAELAEKKKAAAEAKKKAAEAKAS